MAATHDLAAFAGATNPIVRPRGELTQTSRGSAASYTFSWKVLSKPSELRSLNAELDDLAATASEPNVFYEPWMLLPALDAFAGRASFLFLCIFANDRGMPLLCGFFPLEVTRPYAAVPIKVARLWNYLSFEWRAPLVRKGVERQVFQTLVQWMSSEEFPCHLLELSSIPLEGASTRSAIEALNEAGKAAYVRRQVTRALLENVGSTELVLRSSIPGQKLKEFRRLERRLSEQGELAYEELRETADVSEWIDGFLSMEAGGWKGAAGTALACDRITRSFFVRVANTAFERGQLMMLRLLLNGEAIAYKCNFLSAPGAFSFKIAYDEKYRAFSPGVLLELENMRAFQRKSALIWMDSCADPNHFMANHLWKGRRSLQTLLVAPRSGVPEFLLAAMPLARWARSHTKNLIHSKRRRTA